MGPLQHCRNNEAESQPMGDINQRNVFDEIQSLCREFRKRLKAGDQANIDEYLPRIDESAGETLFQNLLHLEIEFRRERGESPSSDNFIQRFPQFSGLIRQAFFESTMMSQEHAKDTPDSVEMTVTLGMPGARKLGEYELLRELGRGGFGVVYEGRHLQRGDRVALKTLPLVLDGQTQSSRDAERLHRFRQEFRSLSEINHPNLAGMQTLEVDGNQWFFTMDLIDGVDFLQHVRPKGSLDGERLRASLKQLVRGIIALHEQGIVHRDLKPSNVLVGSDGRVTILDFGLVAELQHFANETLSIGTQHFAGTPRYAAPEQASGQRSAAVDWYALGVMLYEAMTGEAPFKGSAVDLLIAKQTTDPPLLAHRERVPQDLAQLVDSLLRREPSDRPSDQQIADALGVDSETSIHHNSSAESGLFEDSASGGAPFLVGRESQLAELNSRLHHFSEYGQSEAVFISGRSGEGKTSLAEAFLAGIRRNGEMLVLSGRCYDRESVPFKAIDCLIDPLVAHLRSRDVTELDPLLPDDIGMLAQLFPVLRRVEVIADRRALVSGNIDSRQVRYRAFSALRELLTNIGRGRPTILFVDDLQWGDADSAAALNEVLRPPDGPAVLMLGSYRSDEVDESQFLTEWREKQSDDGKSIEQTVVEVAPLTEAECVLLISSRLGIAPEQLREQSGGLFEDTRGNPYFVEQLIEGFDAETNQFRAVPLDELIDRKLDRLPSAAKALLEAAAIAGQAASVAEVAAVADESASAFATFTHMRSERLVRLVGSGERQLIDTYHDKIRETVLENMGRRRRDRLHVRFGELIEQFENVSPAEAMNVLDRDYLDEDEQPVPTDRVFDLAYHFHAASDPRGFAYQFLAAEQSFRAYASEDAVAYVDRALATLPNDASDSIRFRVWERRASSLARLRMFDEALANYDQALQSANSTESSAHVQYGIARTYQALGRFQEATRNFDAVLGLFGAPRPGVLGVILRTPLLAAKVFLVPYQWQRSRSKAKTNAASWEQRVYSNLAFHIFEVHHPIHFAYVIFRQASSAIRTGQSHNLARGLSEFGGYLAWAGLVGLGQRTLSRASKIAGDSVTDEERGKLQLYGAYALAASGQHRQAASQYREALQLLIKCGLYMEAYMCSHFLRHLCALTADSTSELHWAQEVLRLADETGNVQGRCWGSYDTAVALARGGRMQPADEWIERARERLGDRWMNATGVVFLAAQGFVLIQSSDYQTATLRLEKAWQTTKQQKLANEYIFQALPWLLESTAGPEWLSTTSTRSANRLKKLCREAWMIAWVYPNLKASILRSRGRAYAAIGNQRKAVRCFEAAIE